MVAALSAASLLTASSASAATEVGSDCQATNGVENYTFVQLKRVSFAGLPIAAPSAGVVTKWKVNSAVPTAVGQKLQILRPTGNPNEFQTVAESTPGTVSSGLNSFDTRLPIRAGDRPAAAGAPGGSVPAPLYCSTANPGDEMGALTPASTLGSTKTYPPAPGLVAAISAVVEPDADGDGFGDETQDKCPRSAAVQTTACPIITLGGLSKLRKGSTQILVSASSQASVTVFGTVKVPKKGKKGKTRQIVLQGGTQGVAPGSVVPFSLAYPSTLANALAALPKSKSLRLAVTITTTDLAGQPSTTSLTVKLKGQKKGKAKAKGKGKKG
jgi:hypothetical protein